MMIVGSAIFCYDANGNRSQKIDGSTTSYTDDAENRMTAVSGAAAATFVYNEDGNRVKGVEGGVTTAYIGDYYEWRSDSTTTTEVKYYYAAGQPSGVGRRIAMRTNGVLTWLLGDHLGSATITATENGTLASEQKYTACLLRGCSAALREGQTRSGSLPTDRQYTLRPISR